VLFRGQVQSEPRRDFLVLQLIVDDESERAGSDNLLQLVALIGQQSIFSCQKVVPA